MTDISGFGLQINIKGSNTFPAGFVVTQFADDTDPFDLPSIQIADKAMTLNGTQVSWSKATPIPITLAVVPNSDDDKNLGALFEANRVGNGKKSARDVITMTGVYPDGSTITLTQGIITDGMPGNAVASAGRMKSKTYSFSFENKTEVN